jgi:hypothetical protein
MPEFPRSVARHFSHRLSFWIRGSGLKPRLGRIRLSPSAINSLSMALINLQCLEALSRHWIAVLMHTALCQIDRSMIVRQQEISLDSPLNGI